MDNFDIINIDGFKMQEMYAVNKINHVMKFLLRSDFAYNQYLYSTKILMEDGYSIDDAVKIWYVMFDCNLCFVNELMNAFDISKVGEYVYKLHEYVNKNICKTSDRVSFGKTIFKILTYHQQESE